MSILTTLPDTASVQEIQRNYRRLLDRVKATRNPLFILRNNLPEAVILDVESWNTLVKKMIHKEEKEALTAIACFEEDRRRGKLKKLRGSLTELMTE
ncbi:MAG: type II toxin-antitoxin system Phd/YefM family antitoxin [Candidatus Kerfeldbacteria bacterium]|nr:type II toxin-antitoxin system Phd/YefM family antitoxin [Candidatus Kerfeldbacteria bacterium]